MAPEETANGRRPAVKTERFVAHMIVREEDDVPPQLLLPLSI